jgi:chloride channel 3/4/5
VGRAWNRAEGWFATALIGLVTALIAFLVDVSVATLSDLKQGYCSSNILLNRNRCCSRFDPPEPDWRTGCEHWVPWTTDYGSEYAIYVAAALLFAGIAGAVTMTTRATLPAPETSGVDSSPGIQAGKIMYMAASSGIPEIKTILSGFVIPGFLHARVMVVKAVGASFAVATGLCLGKEGPFVHISTCVGFLVANLFPKYRGNPRKLREILGAGCSAGLSVAFGAPIGGVLFAWEVTAQSFLCLLYRGVSLVN